MNFEGDLSDHGVNVEQANVVIFHQPRDTFQYFRQELPGDHCAGLISIECISKCSINGPTDGSFSIQ